MLCVFLSKSHTAVYNTQHTDSDLDMLFTVHMQSEFQESTSIGIDLDLHSHVPQSGLDQSTLIHIIQICALVQRAPISLS